jgi:hypothetical protein
LPHGLAELPADNGNEAGPATAGNGFRNPKEAPKPHEGNGAAPGGRQLCGAKTRGGGTCRKPPLAGRTRCRLHGGATPVGIGSPHWKHGKRSRYLKHLPQVMEAGQKAALGDPELLSLKDELALLSARIAELLSSLGNEGTTWEDAIWLEIRQCIQDRARLAQVEHRREVDMQCLMPVDDALAFARALLDACAEVITDRKLLAALMERCRQFLPRPEDR